LKLKTLKISESGQDMVKIRTIQTDDTDYNKQCEVSH